MCGIVGYVGLKNAPDIIMSGLRRLEYRGYDSAGLALCAETGGPLRVVKCAGKIANLNEHLNKMMSSSIENFTLGIGHTRWATHGEPTMVNAHPHLSENGEFAIVHNGIIENHDELKKKLIGNGCRFLSDTDSEVIAHLVEVCYNGCLRDAVAAALKQLEGTYGVAVMSARHPDMIVTARKGSPIVIGVCDDEAIVASDASAIINYTRRVIFLDDGDIVVATPSNIEIVSKENVPVSRETVHIEGSVSDVEKGGYKHFTLKEIHEQPQSLTNAMRGRLMMEEGIVKLDGMRMGPAETARIDRVVIAACGTSYHAGMVGKYYLEDFAGIPTEVQQAAEFRDRNPIIQRNTCMMAISQSGETADTLYALREALMKGVLVLGICNVVASTIAREAGRGVYIHAGPEIGVASTKAVVNQIAVLAMIALHFARTRCLSPDAGRAMLRELSRLPELVEKVMEQEPGIRKIAAKYAGAESFFYIGRGYMYPAALEGALKLKEISYIHAEGYHAAELKHGPIALLGVDVPVVVNVPDISGKKKTVSNMKECQARKSPVIAIATDGDDEIVSQSDEIIRIPKCAEFLTPVPVIVAEQLLAYHIAEYRGCEIDQPRNLAKSVTVE